MTPGQTNALSVSRALYSTAASPSTLFMFCWHFSHFLTRAALKEKIQHLLEIVESHKNAQTKLLGSRKVTHYNVSLHLVLPVAVPSVYITSRFLEPQTRPDHISHRYFPLFPFSLAWLCPKPSHNYVRNFLTTRIRSITINRTLQKFLDKITVRKKYLETIGETLSADERTLIGERSEWCVCFSFRFLLLIV